MAAEWQLEIAGEEHRAKDGGRNECSNQTHVVMEAALIWLWRTCSVWSSERLVALQFRAVEGIGGASVVPATDFAGHR